MKLQKLEKSPAIVPLEQRPWSEIGKWFAVHCGRWAVIGAFLGSSLYVAGSKVVEESRGIVSDPVAEQGAILNTTLEDKSKTIDEVANVAKKVDEQISTITKDWEVLRDVLRDEFGIDIEKPREEENDDQAQALPPDTAPAMETE